MSRRRRGWVTIHTLMSNKTVSHKPLEVQGTKPVPWLKEGCLSCRNKKVAMSRRRRGWVTIHTLMSNKTVSHKPLEVQGTKPVPWLIDPNTIVSHLCWSLSDVSGSQDVFLVQHPSELKVGDVCPLCVQWRVDTEVLKHSHDGFSNMVVTHEEEAAKTQHVSIKEDLVVRALVHNKKVVRKEERPRSV
ncbi:hypothetical protein F2Q69_00016861 [Brassica cretica]|uniref:Uncharacterized protein n=1 Tax=Brassica cretica TaxID=69181 RepID=A0A8S9R206_BRACR|nr:hypothetical protein F2Q69_00016861 [Brassica cretica]